MGGALTAKSLKDTPGKWTSVVVVSSFGQLSDVIETKLSVLPKMVRGFCGDTIYAVAKFRTGNDYRESRPKDWVLEAQTPVMVAHGTADKLISLEQAKELYESYGSQKKSWVEVPDASHSNVLITPMPLYAEMANWLLQNQ